MASEYQGLEDDSNQYDPIDQWECLMCFKTVPEPGPLFPNPDHCCCPETDLVIVSHGGQPQATAVEQVVYHCELLEATNHHQSSSYASSSVSITCPEGPERKDITTLVANWSLSVVPDLDVVESQRRRSTPPSSDMSFQMLQFFVEHDRRQALYIAESDSSGSRCLPQNGHFRSDEGGGSSKITRSGYESIVSSRHSELSHINCDVDPTAGVGTWDVGGLAQSCGGYPLTMSGLVDFPTEG